MKVFGIRRHFVIVLEIVCIIGFLGGFLGSCPLAAENSALNITKFLDKSDKELREIVLNPEIDGWLRGLALEKLAQMPTVDIVDMVGQFLLLESDPVLCRTAIGLLEPLAYHNPKVFDILRQIVKESTDLKKIEDVLSTLANMAQKPNYGQNPYLNEHFLPIFKEVIDGSILINSSTKNKIYLQVKAIEALGKIVQWEWATQILLDMLRLGGNELAYSAVISLENIGLKDHTWSDSDFALRQTVIQSISKIESPVVKSLLDRDFDDGGLIGYEAALALDRVDDFDDNASALDKIRSASRKFKPSPRGEILTSLAQTILNHPDPEICRVAAYAFGRLGGAEAISFLIEILAINDVDEELKYKHDDIIRDVILSIGTPEVILALKRGLIHPWSETHRIIAAWIYGAMGAPDTPSDLKLVLKQDPSNQVRVVAAWGLAKKGDSEAISFLEDRLIQDHDPGVRIMAAYFLGDIQNNRSSRILMNVLKQDPASTVRQAAAEALAHVGKVHMIPSLQKVFTHEPNEDVRHSVEKTLGMLLAQENSIDVLQKIFFDDTQKDIHPYVAQALARLGSPEALAMLDKKLWNDQDHGDCEDWFNALTTIGGPQALSILEKLIVAAKWSYRPYEALVKIGGAEAVSLAEKAMVEYRLIHDQNGGMPGDNAIHCLSEIGSPEAVLALERGLSNPSLNNFQQRIIQGLNNIRSPEAFLALKRTLLNPHMSDSHQFVLQALSNFPDAETVSLLENYMLNESIVYYRREQAATCLGKIGTQDALKALEKALDDSTVSQKAVAALGEMVSLDAVHILERALYSKNNRSAAAQALGISPMPQALQVLEKALSDDGLSDIHSAITDALTKRGGPKALAILEKNLSETSQLKTRNTVVQSLIAFGNAESIPLLEKALFQSELEPSYGKIIEALSQSDDPEAILILEKAVGSDHPSRRELAACALVRRNLHPELISLVVQLLSSEDLKKIKIAVSALAHRKDATPEAFLALKKILFPSINDDNARDAVDALEKIGTPEVIEVFEEFLKQYPNNSYNSSLIYPVRNALSRLKK